MLKSDIEKFIKRVTKNEKISFVLVKFKSQKTLGKNTDAQTSIFVDKEKKKIGCLIELNKSSFYGNNVPAHQSILLHELGHYFSSSGKRSPLNEYLAQKFSINKAKQMNLPKTVSALKAHITSWKYLPWKDGKIYRLAYCIAKRRHLI